MADVITAATNPRLKLVRQLASAGKRQRLGLFAAEGEDLVAAALDAGLEPVEALVDASRPVLLDRLSGATLVDGPLMAGLSTLPHPARVIGVFRRADLPTGTDAAVGLALWRIQDPGNIGTLIRAADALGPAFVALSAGCADPTGPKALRAGVGATFRVPLVAWDDVTGPKIALTMDAPTAIWDAELPQRATFLLGAEREGLPEDVVAGCDLAVSVPLGGSAESLNVAMAGTVALYEHRRRRG